MNSYDVAVDGSDNFPTRFLSNDACYFARKPLVYGSIFRFEGQMTVFAPHLGGPCYRCMLPELPPPGAAPSCAEAGVLGVLPGVIGCLQAMEAIKLLLGTGTPPLGRLICYDGLRTSFREVRIQKDTACRLCGPDADIGSVSNTETMSGQGCGVAASSISVSELRNLLEADPATAVIDVRQPEEHALNSIPGSRLIPLGELASRLHELPKAGKFYVHCKSGRRSAEAVVFMHRHGFDRAVDVIGGIDAWQASK